MTRYAVALWAGAVVAASAAAYEPVPNNPSPTALLKRLAAAHAKLGPVQIQNTLDEMNGTRVLSRSRQTVLRNGPRQYHVEFSEGGMTIRLIANGDRQVIHNVTRNVRREGPLRRGDLAMPFSRVRDELASGMKDPKTAKALRAATVTREKVGTEPCYRLEWGPPVSLGGLPLKALSVGVKDGLMRRIVLQDDNATLRATALYTFRSAPFPAETFAFPPEPEPAEEPKAEE